MPLTEEQIAFLKNLDKSYIHAKNMLAKKKDKNRIQKFFIEYEKFHKSLDGPLELEKAVESLNCYKNFVSKENRNDSGKLYFSAQTKFEPSIIEEFICQVLKSRFGNDVLSYGSVKAYSSLYFSYSNKETFKENIEIKFNVKDQDVGIFKNETLTTNGKKHELHIPIVCIECKTFLDKTMYEGSVATASKIKNGNPQCLFFIVTETYDVSSSVDIETTQIDNIYVLRKQKRPKSKKNRQQTPIQADVLEHMLGQIESHMTREQMSVDEMIQQKGYLRQQNRYEVKRAHGDSNPGPAD